MGSAPLTFEAAELLASDPVAEPLVAGGVRCHGGFAADGAYVPPRTKHRVPAIRAWQDAHVAAFGRPLLDAPISLWPEPFPNVAQTKHLLREGVREPTIVALTRIGTVEGFGSMIRHVDASGMQRHFAEPIDGTALDHLGRGLFEAHARDEAGYSGEAGHEQMWFAARDIAFERPVTADETQTMLARLGIAPPGASGPPAGAVASAPRRFPELDPALETMIRRMISLLFIEVSAFHTFAWAEEVLGDADLVAGDGEAAVLVRCIRADETPHVEYLRTALTEMRDRTFVGTSGARVPGERVVSTLWDDALAQSLGPNRDQQRRATLAELERALAGHPRRGAVLDEFHALARPAPDPRP
jgi:hypothetical protein